MVDDYHREIPDSFPAFNGTSTIRSGLCARLLRVAAPLADMAARLAAVRASCDSHAVRRVVIGGPVAPASSPFLLVNRRPALMPFSADNYRFTRGYCHQTHRRLWWSGIRCASWHSSETWSGPGVEVLAVLAQGELFCSVACPLCCFSECLLVLRALAL